MRLHDSSAGFVVTRGVHYACSGGSGGVDDRCPDSCLVNPRCPGCGVVELLPDDWLRGRWGLLVWCRGYLAVGYISKKLLGTMFACCDDQVV